MINKDFERCQPIEPIENELYYAEAIGIHNEDVLPKVKRGCRRDFEIGSLIENGRSEVLKESFTFLKIYIYGIEKFEYINIKKKLQEKYPNRKADMDLLKEIKKTFPIKIKAQFSNNIWTIVDFDKLFESLK